MTSKRQIEANRENAKRSTGPKTQIGKSRSNRNALRHGLARGARGDKVGMKELTSAMTGGLAPDVSAAVATDLARGRVRLAEIRSIRVRMLAALLEEPTPKQAKRIVALERYERAAQREQRRLLKSLRAHV